MKVDDIFLCTLPHGARQRASLKVREAEWIQRINSGSSHGKAAMPAHVGVKGNTGKDGKCGGRGKGCMAPVKGNNYKGKECLECGEVLFCRGRVDGTQLRHLAPDDQIYECSACNKLYIFNSTGTLKLSVVISMKVRQCILSP